MDALATLMSSGYSFTSTNDFDLMREVYSKIGAGLNLGNATNIYSLLDDIFAFSSSHITMASTSNAGKKMLVPNLYGGCRVLDAKGETSRIKKLTSETLLPGDIIICASNPSKSLPDLTNYCDMYIYLGNDTFLTYDGGISTFTANGIDRTAHSTGGAKKYLDDELIQLFGASAFAVLRPSLY
jgi:hypothetical protein